MNESLGKSLQRTKRTEARGNRSKYRQLIGEERHAAEQIESGGGGGQAGADSAQQGRLQSIWQTNDLQDFLSIADAREEGYFAERDVRVVVGGAVHVMREDKMVPMSDDKRDWVKLSESLPVPRRPPWTYDMSPEDVQAAPLTTRALTQGRVRRLHCACV